MYTIDTYMYPLSDKPLEQISLDLPQYFTQDEDTSAISFSQTEQQRAAMSQLLDAWILEFEVAYSEYVQGGQECQKQSPQDQAAKQSSI